MAVSTKREGKDDSVLKRDKDDSVLKRDKDEVC